MMTIPQYYNQARGDARYQPLDADLTDIAALTGELRSAEQK